MVGLFGEREIGPYISIETRQTLEGWRRRRYLVV